MGISLFGSGFGEFADLRIGRGRCVVVDSSQVRGGCLVSGWPPAAPNDSRALPTRKRRLASRSVFTAPQRHRARSAASIGWLRTSIALSAWRQSSGHATDVATSSAGNAALPTFSRSPDDELKVGTSSRTETAGWTLSAPRLTFGRPRNATRSRGRTHIRRQHGMPPSKATRPYTSRSAIPGNCLSGRSGSPPRQRAGGGLSQVRRRFGTGEASR